MENTTQQWIKESCFKLSEALDFAIFIIDAEKNIIEHNTSTTKLLNASGEQQSVQLLEELIKAIPKFDWRHFWRYKNRCYQLNEVLINQQPVNLILVNLGNQSAIGFILADNVKTYKLQKEYTYLLEEANLNRNFQEIVSQNAKYIDILKRIEQVSYTDTTILIEGETGSGKKLLARTAYNLSSRRSHPLISANCAAIAEDGLESALFGHEKGAFIGAFEQKSGYFELANQGTLLLEEIGELPLALQARVLRVLKEGTFERAGGEATLTTDVRVLATTNKNLQEMMAQGKFRSDLYYYLSAFPVHSIPLRERRDDIPLLVNYFRKKIAKKMGKKIHKMSDSALRQLMLYDFPGNVKELENIIERGIILSKDNTLNINAVMPNFKLRVDEQGESEIFPTFEEVQRAHIIKALNKVQWRVSGEYSASKLLGLNPKTLTSKMRKLKINRKELSSE